MRGFRLDKLLHCISSITDYKEKEKHDKDSDDIISGLPDDVLRLILSSLQFKDAFAMSLLSRRWRYLWSSLSSLNFDCIETYVLRIMVKKKSLKKERQKLIKFVNNAVGYYQGVTLEEFMVTFPFDNTCASAIDKWVEFSLSKKVQKLVLNFNDFTLLLGPQDYHFPNKLLSTFSFTSLKELGLHRVGITEEEDIQYILSSSVLLERLVLDEVYNLHCIRLTNPSLVLKSLEMKYCPLHTIEIRDINLVSLRYQDIGAKKMLLRNLPLLVEIEIGTSNTANDFDCLSHFNTQLEIFMLTVTFVLRNPVVDVFPQLFKLNRLVLNICLLENDNLGLVGSFLRAAPCLETLKLELQWECAYGSRRPIGVRWKTRLGCGHDCLKVVELAGYNGRDIVYQLVIDMFDTFVLLQKMVIDPRHQSYHQFQLFSPKSIKETDNMRELAKQQLHGKNPPGVDLVFL